MPKWPHYLALGCTAVTCFISGWLLGFLQFDAPEWIRWTVQSNTAASWMQAVFTFLAFVGTLWVASAQARNERARDVQQNKPRLVIETWVQQVKPQLTIKLRGVGLGPAIVDSYEVALDGRPIAMGGDDPWKPLIEQLDLPGAVDTGGAVIGKNYIVGKDQQLDLLRWQAITTVPSNEKLHEQKRRIRVTIHYRSIHREHGVASTDKEIDRDIEF